MRRTRAPEAGLTLVEVLVALAIMAGMVGAAVLGLGALERGARAETEALRLADRLQLASDVALVANAPLALIWDPAGYAFARWDAASQSWRPSAERLLAARRDLPGALRLARADDQAPAPVVIAPDPPRPPLTLRVIGGAAPWSVTFDGLNAIARPQDG